MNRRYAISRSALADIERLSSWTNSRFGEAVRIRYTSLLRQAFVDLAANPLRLGGFDRPELGPDARSYHIRYNRTQNAKASESIRNPRHIVVFRVQDEQSIVIGRVLYDAMDLLHHVVPDDFLVD